MFRKSSLIAALVIACTVLFGALDGIGYAAGHSSKNANLAVASKKKAKGKRGPRGPVGPQGSTGAAGTPGAPGAPGTSGADGTARGYARVKQDGTLDTANSKGVVSAQTAGNSLICFDLEFTPKNIVATIEQYATDHPNESYGLVSAGLGRGITVCPAGTDAYVATAKVEGGSAIGARYPVFVMFN